MTTQTISDPQRGVNPIWDFAILTSRPGIPQAPFGVLDGGLARSSLRSTGLDDGQILSLEGDEPADWTAQLQARLDTIAASRERPWVLLIWSGGFDAGAIALPPNLRLGVVDGQDARWGITLLDGTGRQPPLRSPRGYKLDAALDDCRSKVRGLALREALGGSAAQVSPDDVQLTGTPSGSWTSEPFALAIKTLATPPSKIGDMVVYINSSNNPGTVQGFSPGSDCWSWANAAWPAAFKLTQTSGDAGVNKQSGTWQTLNEGGMTATPTTPSGGSWYNIRAAGSSTIIGHLWLNSASSPTSFRWYGRSTNLDSSGRFDLSSTSLEFIRASGAPTIFIGFKMFIP